MQNIMGDDDDDDDDNDDDDDDGFYGSTASQHLPNFHYLFLHHFAVCKFFLHPMRHDAIQQHGPHLLET